MRIRKVHQPSGGRLRRGITITVEGPPKSGKTTAIVHIARALVHHGRQSVLVVNPHGDFERVYCATYWDEVPSKRIEVRQSLAVDQQIEQEVVIREVVTVPIDF